MGTYVIKMPDIGEGIAEVELVHWYVKPGDVVAEEQVLADVMTEKANVEIPSHVAGKVVALNGKPGDVIAVGTEIIRLEVEGKGNVSDSSPKYGATPEKKDDITATPKPAPKLESVPPPPPKPAPVLKVVAPAPEPESPAGDRPLAAPAIRRRARELGIDLSQVQGSGPE